jgi:hypothetical protein
VMVRWWAEEGLGLPRRALRNKAQKEGEREIASSSLSTVMWVLLASAPVQCPEDEGGPDLRLPLDPTI